MKFILKILQWITTIMVPVVLILLPVRVLLTRLYINIEYRLPGFPQDPYGFTLDERLYWADISRQYLLNREEINYLGDQELDENTPLYNQRELSHMLDVKIVVRGALMTLWGCILFLLLFGAWSWRTKRWESFKFALSRGGWYTAGLIILIMVYLALNFDSLFTNFHRIFFEGDTWRFQYSDTLIRLFPLRFWRDAFIGIGSAALLAGGSLGYFIRTWGEGQGEKNR